MPGPEATSSGTGDSLPGATVEPDGANQENPESNPEHKLSEEKIKAIKEAMGETALIATQLSEEDRRNVEREVIDLKSKNGSGDLAKLTRIPVIGGPIKIAVATRWRNEARKKVEETGSLESAFTALGLEPTKSAIINGDSKTTRERAWQTLKNAGYDDNNRIKVATSRLDQNEKVERMNGKSEDAVKKALNDYYLGLKQGRNQEELDQNFSKNIKDAFIGEENIGTSINLESQKEGIKKLVSDESITEQDIKAYLDQHVSLYKTNMKEGIYTEKKVDNITKAVIKGGLVGGLAVFLLTRLGRKGARSILGTTLGTTGVGAVIGGFSGGFGGANKAKIKLSEAEIKAVNSFEEESSSDNQATSPDSDSGDSQPQPQSEADPGDSQPQPQAESDSDPGNSQPQPQAESDSSKSKQKAGIDPGDSQPQPQAESDSDPGASQPQPQAESDSSKSKQKAGIFAKINNFKRNFTKEEEIISEIEKLRDRKNATDLIKNLDNLIQNLNPADAKTREELMDAYADIIARGRFSSEKKIDLIKYKNNRSSLEEKLSEVEKKLFGDNPKAIDENTELNQLLQNKRAKLHKSFDEADALRDKFIRRSIGVGAVQGALIGAGAGAIFGALKNSGVLTLLKRDNADSIDTDGDTSLIDGTNANAIGDNNIEDSNIDTTGQESVKLIEDPDGGFSVKLGEKVLIGEGDKPGVEFDGEGKLTDASKEMLTAAGVQFEEYENPIILENATKNVSLEEFFSPENKEVNNLTEITGRSWIANPDGRDQVTIEDIYMDGSNGDTILQVVPTQGSNVNLEGMKLFITPVDGNVGITVDVNPDGTVEIPADSPAASFFNGNSFQGSYAEVIREGEDGHIDVYHTIGNGQPGVTSITVPNPDATYIQYEYNFTIDGQTYEGVPAPEGIVAAAQMDALRDIESIKGTGEPITYEADGEITNLTTSTGEPVEVEHFEHHGGYSDTADTYFGEKDGVYNSGASVIRQMVGEEGKGLSSQEVDRIFLDKINSGEISEGDVIENYLETMGKSPEAITTTRAMMGDFWFDIDGDGTQELIDTQDKINIVSDIISRSTPENYDDFVNDTFARIYDAINGGSIRFVDYSQEQYQYTTWGILGEDNNILQRLGVTGNRQTDGVGIIFLDKNGNSIYDEATVRKLWHIPDDYKLEYIGDRLNCIQKTARGIFPNPTSEPDNPQSTTPEPTTLPPDTPEPTTLPPDTPEPTLPPDTPEPTLPPDTPEPTPIPIDDSKDPEAIEQNMQTGDETSNYVTPMGPGELTDRPDTSQDSYQAEQDYAAQAVEEAHNQASESSTGQTVGEIIDNADQTYADHETYTPEQLAEQQAQELAQAEQNAADVTAEQLVSQAEENSQMTDAEAADWFNQLINGGQQ